MNITRKIEIAVINEPKEDKDKVWAFLRRLNGDIFRAANQIISDQFFQDTFEEKVVQPDKIKLEGIEKELTENYDNLRKAEKKAEKSKFSEKIERLNKDKNKILNEARQEARKMLKELFEVGKNQLSWRMISEKYPYMGSYIFDALNQKICKDYANDYFDVVQGRRSTRSYKKGMPIPFRERVVKLSESGFRWIQYEEGKYIQFAFVFGRDRNNNKVVIERLLSGEYKLSDSSLQLKDNKLFALLSIQLPESKTILDKDICVGVDLGVQIPVYCALNQGLERVSLGNIKDLLKTRLQMQERRKRLQQNLKLAQGGKGRNKKLKASDRLEEQERNYVKTYNHQLSKGVIDFALKNNAGTIKLEFLEGFGKEEKNRFILRNWSYFELQTMIAYKAQMNNISIVKIDPYHTSQTCAECGHYEQGQREKQAEFVCKNEKCKNVGVTMNADYNAAKNIANSTKIVSKQSECEYYKQKNEVVNDE